MGPTLNFSNAFGDNMVLQMAPQRAAVHGYTGQGAAAAGATGDAPRVRVTIDGDQSYSVDAVVDARRGTWKALLRPVPAGGTYTVKAACTAGCNGVAQLKGVTFGDVWYCAGQSNM